MGLEFRSAMRFSLQFSFALGLIAFQFGCTPWPNEATGGLAERHSTQSFPIHDMERRYAVLLNAGGMRRAASRMVDANLLLTRARREHAAGLTADYQLTVDATDELLISLEQDLLAGSSHRGTARAEK